MHGIRFFYQMDIFIWHSRKRHRNFQGFSKLGSSRKTRISKTSAQHRIPNVLSKFAFRDSSLGLEAITKFSIFFLIFRFSFKFLITEALDKQLRIKISDKNCEWRFDESFIIVKFVKTKSQILVSSLYAKMCARISLHVIKNATMWNVESDN